jgi:alkaline phosphatase D
VNTLLQNATQAFREYAPIRFGRGDSAGRIYRHVPYGPDLDVFVIDRSVLPGTRARHALVTGA